jgi:soluble lytic murein transglycosylase-like protein
MAAVYESEIPLPSKANRRVPKALDAVVMKALDRNRDKRYQSALDLIRELSLAAGSTAWSKERCAEMVRERFAERLRNMEKLLSRIPRESSGSTDQHAAISEPSEGRTVMVQRPTAPPVPLAFDVPMRTTIESGPAVAEARERASRILEQRQQVEPTGEAPEHGGVRTPPLPIEPKASRQGLPPVGGAPHRQATPNPQPPKASNPPPPQPARQGTPPPQASLSLGDELFGDLDSKVPSTRVMQGPRVSMRDVQTVTTDPSRESVNRRGPAPRAPIVIAGTPPVSDLDVVRLVERWAPHYSIDPALALALIRVESRFDAAAVSPKNAQGLMQLIPATASRFGVKNAFDVVDNLKGGLAYLQWLMSYFKGDVALVLAAYNAGEHAVDRYRGIPPYSETRAYVKQITAIYTKPTHPYGGNIAAPR